MLPQQFFPRSQASEHSITFCAQDGSHPGGQKLQLVLRNLDEVLDTLSVINRRSGEFSEHSIT
jgi:hypothetical protein